MPVTTSGGFDGFRYEILDGFSTTAVLKVWIPCGKSIRAIPGCMFSTSSNVSIKGKYHGNFKAIVGIGDSRYQILSVEEDSGKEGWVMLSPGFYGSISVITVNPGDEICVGDNAFLASIGDGIKSVMKSQGVKKALFSGSGLFVKKVKAEETGGIIFVCAVGSMMSFNIPEEESIIVDNGHLVTWPNHMQYDMQKAAKNWFRSAVSGEGIVSKLTGPGTVNVQTRSPEDMAEWIYDQKTPSG